MLPCSDDLGRTFDIAIPLNTALRLEISSGGLLLEDDKGVALAATAVVPILQAAGQNEPTLTFNIKGKK